MSLELVFILQLHMRFYRIGHGIAHLSVSWTRQAGKVRRYVCLFVVSEYPRENSCR